MRRSVLKIFLLCSILLALSLGAHNQSLASSGEPPFVQSVLVAGNDNYYPIEYYNSHTGKYEGIMPMVLDLVSERSGVDFVYIKSDGRTQQKLVEESGAQIVSAYVMASVDDYTKDKVKVFTYSDHHDDIDIGLAFTHNVDDSLIEFIKSEVSKITAEDVNGIFVRGGFSEPDNHLTMVYSAFGICVLMLFIVVGLSLKIRRYQKKDDITKMTDAETGIGNLMYFEQRFDNTLFDFSRNHYHIAYIIIDSNYLGAYHGEATLSDAVKYTADVLKSFVKSDEIIARITETGFVYAFQSMDILSAEKKIKATVTKLNKYVSAQDGKNEAIFHAALYSLNSTDRSCDTLIFNLRRNCSKLIDTREAVAICNSKDMNSALEEKKMTEEFSKGFSDNEFKLYIQFIVDNKTKKCRCAEALSRWAHPEKGLITPGQYIKKMEDTGFITKLDFYMFDKVCAQLEQWQETDFDDVYISCNFTRLTLSEEHFSERLESIVSKYKFDKSKLVIEITEEALEKDRQTAISNVFACKNMGFRIALDDLGSGYTSLINLCDYPIDIVKLDREILLKADSESGKALFDGIVALAHSLNLEVVCEGVETYEQNEVVSASSCDFVQGWYYSKAMPAQDAMEFAKEYNDKLPAICM